MSTTFNIIPTKVDHRLTFQNVMTLAKQTLENQLNNLSINTTINFSANIHQMDEVYTTKISLENGFAWTENEYAWFTIENAIGGTDAYCKNILEHLVDYDTYLEDTLEDITLTATLKQQIIDCGNEWYFRRSAGQSAIVNIAYGHLAAAVAKLTDGYIYTYDGAWHDSIFPATGDQLLNVYFYPDKAKNADDYEWTNKCIDGLKKQFARR